MAGNTVKSSCFLDGEAVRQPGNPANRTEPSESAMLGRTGRSATKQVFPDERERLDSLDRLQGRLALDRGVAAGWEERVNRERRAGGRGA